MQNIIDNYVCPNRKKSGLIRKISDCCNTVSYAVNLTAFLHIKLDFYAFK